MIWLNNHFSLHSTARAFLSGRFFSLNALIQRRGRSSPTGCTLCPTSSLYHEAFRQPAAWLIRGGDPARHSLPRELLRRGSPPFFFPSFNTLDGTASDLHFPFFLLAPPSSFVDTAKQPPFALCRAQPRGEGARTLSSLPCGVCKARTDPMRYTVRVDVPTSFGHLGHDPKRSSNTLCSIHLGGLPTAPSSSCYQESKEDYGRRGLDKTMYLLPGHINVCLMAAFLQIMH